MCTVLLPKEITSKLRTVQAIASAVVVPHNSIVRPCCWTHRTQRNQACNKPVNPSSWLTFITSKGITLAIEGEKSSTALPSCEPCKLQ